MAHRLMIVDDSNIIRRHIERVQDLPGVEFVGAARNGQLMQGDPDILILVISALADKLTAIDALEKGARGFLHKPLPTVNSTTHCAS